jgi:PAS domain S-box-containing protein
LDAILEQNADGIMILDYQLTILRFNPSLGNMTGWNTADAIGKPHHDIFKWHGLRTDTDLAEALSNGWPLPGAAHLYVEGDLIRPDGKQISLGITYSPLMNHRGNMTNIIANVRDLTRYREEQALQKTFISVVSHELKTPVSIIKGFAGTLKRPDANWPPEMTQEYAAVIEDEADRLNDLIDNLLEASRLQSGTFKLNLTDEILLGKVASDTVLRLQNQTAKHTFSIKFPDNFPVVYGDERRLTQVFNNLLSNAIKYSPDGGDILISGQVHAEFVTVSVQDEGIGIPKHQQHRIFEKFSRLDNALSRNTEGTGLGLFLTKAIIEAHGGRIWFSRNTGDSSQEMPGTTFTFSLPRSWGGKELDQHTK